MLQQVKRSAARSKAVMGELQHLKSKVFELENSVLHVHDDI